MARRIVLLSGRVGSGKSSVATELVRQFDFHVFKSNEYLKARAASSGRTRLQRFGEKLDRETDGAWVVDSFVPVAMEASPDTDYVVDAVRTKEQIDRFRTSYGRRVVHVHLTAPESTLAARWAQRPAHHVEPATYDEVARNPTERRVEELRSVADIVVDSVRTTPGDTVVRVACRLGLHAIELDRCVDVLVGGEYGSEGKGQVSEYLASEYDVLVRVGGPNAGHKVFERPNPITFHHLPSGTKSCSGSIVVGPGAVLGLKGLLGEIQMCELGPSRLAIDPLAMMIEPRDVELETRELKGSIGSTAQGVGRATARKVLRTSGKPRPRLARDVPELRPYIRETVSVLDRAYTRGQRVFLEGTQGTALSLHHGIYPYVTSRDTTASGCLAEAGIPPGRVRRTIMVCRTYPIRVQNPDGGTSGPMSLELEWEEIARRSGIPLAELLDTEITSTTKRKRRVGEFDWTLLRRAAALNGPTDIALTFADYLSSKNSKARRFEQLTRKTIRFIDEVESVAGAPVSLVATRFHFRSIIDRRSWRDTERTSPGRERGADGGQPKSGW